MCYLYLKLRVFLERKFQPKSVLKCVVFFIYSRLKYDFRPCKKKSLDFNLVIYDSFVLDPDADVAC